MGKRPKKKVVLFLVEGLSDFKALSYAIPQYYEEIDEDYEVYFPILHDSDQDGGDITSKYGIRPDTIENCINKLFIHDFLRDYGLYPKDIMEIVQIVDMDGAYIPAENVVPLAAPEERRTIYGEEKIEASNVDAIVERNARKAANLDHLSSLDSIKVASKTVKYSVYYFSTNLDHFLHGNANMESREKCTKAEGFTECCISNPDYFWKTFESSENELADMSYEDSWSFIKEGCNSLKRYSNLHILLKRIKSET